MADANTQVFNLRNIISSIISVITQYKGVYCDGQFNPKGAYIYLSVIQFISLSIILCALFTYLSVYNNEWKQGQIRAHGMFWCVKGPIMVIFYFGDILLAALQYLGLIKDKAPATPSGTFWPAAAIKNGYYVLIICSCMTVVSILMQIYFGLDAKDYKQEDPEMNYFEALADGFLAYIPQFIKNVFNCGGDTVVLAKKRIKLRKERRLSDDERDLLSNAASHAGTVEYLSQPLPSLQQQHDQEDRYHQYQPHNFNALPLEPLGGGPTSPIIGKEENNEKKQRAEEVDELQVISYPQIPAPLPQMPAPPMQSRTINRNDEISLESLNQGSSHFTPHDLERK